MRRYLKVICWSNFNSLLSQKNLTTTCKKYGIEIIVSFLISKEFQDIFQNTNSGQVMLLEIKLIFLNSSRVRRKFFTRVLEFLRQLIVTYLRDFYK